MNPFPGLRPFQPNEADLFMGREVVQGSLATRIRVSPLTLLVARSGVGKSSFLTCRLIPQLRKDSDVRYLNEWGSASPQSLIRTSLSGMRSEGFREKPLLVLDQFEDIFKLPGSRDALWDSLAEVVNVESSQASILVSMREEWLGAWGETADYLPPNFGSVVRLAPLNPRELDRAIRRPPEVEGSVTVEPALAELLINDLRRPTAFGLGDGNVEPGLLQLACHRLWAEASQTPERCMTVALYDRLGGADRMAREFVWNELGKAGAPGRRFDAFDRVLWAGMTRHLVVAQGIKAITDNRSMARKIRIEDLGFAGPAVAKARLPKLDNEYMRQMPERRGDPPEGLVAWIADVVEKGVQAGFLKQQHGVSLAPNEAEAPNLNRLFEISHDSLSDLFRQFSVEFESWVRGRWAKLVGVLFGLLVVLPFFVSSWIANGLLKTLIGAVIAVLGLVVYLLFVVVMALIMNFVFGLVAYPVIRRLARGMVPLPADRHPEKPKWITRLTDLARRVGFLPR